MSTKRLLDAEITEPSIKRRKLNNNASDISMISSICFTDNSDQQQFQTLFKTIDGLQLIKSLNIPQLITKEIAEYSTGKFAKCGNSECQNDISLLHQHNCLYDANDREHIYAYKLGYKYCSYSLKHYCVNCMNNAQPCTECYCDSYECKQLKYIPECDQCTNCEKVIPHCVCGECDECCYDWYCSNCDWKGCNDCYGTDECISCHNDVCEKCRIKDGLYNNHKYDDELYTICNGCYDDSMIECDKCHMKYKLFFENNRWLGKWNHATSCSEMVKCSFAGCNNFICMNCNENEQNGKYIACCVTECDEKIGFFCNMHIQTTLLCYTHMSRALFV